MFRLTRCAAAIVITTALLALTGCGGGESAAAKACSDYFEDDMFLSFISFTDAEVRQDGDVYVVAGTVNAELLDGGSMGFPASCDVERKGSTWEVTKHAGPS